MKRFSKKICTRTALGISQKYGFRILSSHFFFNFYSLIAQWIHQNLYISVHKDFFSFSKIISRIPSRIPLKSPSRFFFRILSIISSISSSFSSINPSGISSSILVGIPSKDSSRFATMIYLVLLRRFLIKFIQLSCNLGQLSAEWCMARIPLDL